MTFAIVFPGHEALATSMGLTPIPWTWRHFPDGESYVRIASCHSRESGNPEVPHDLLGSRFRGNDREGLPNQISILCSLNNPDAKLFPLIMVASTLKRMGATHITLITPYLGYMRQDKEFAQGEAISSHILGHLLSQYVDHIITVDPHLHRIQSLEEVFTIPTTVLHANNLLADHIQKHVVNPLIIGPDAESRQWVEQIATQCSAPYVIASKIRHGDKDVTVSLPDLAPYTGCNPVLVDDVISSGHTLYEAAKAINHPNLTIMAVHGIFAEDAFALLQSITSHIITTNTIPHETNRIDITQLL